MKMSRKSDKAEYDHTSLDVIYSSLNGSVFHQEKTRRRRGKVPFIKGIFSPLRCCHIMKRVEKYLGAIKIFSLHVVVFSACSFISVKLHISLALFIYVVYS